jgi:hypothetical protein
MRATARAVTRRAACAPSNRCVSAYRPLASTYARTQATVAPTEPRKTPNGGKSIKAVFDKIKRLFFKK